MRTYTVTHTVYTFDELSDKAKEKAVSDLWDLNVDYDWWDFTYDDAANSGLKITAFDLGRGSYVEGKFLWSALKVAEAILKNHGDQCGTYKTAQDYMVEYRRLVEEQCQEDADRLYSEFACEMDLYDLDTGEIDQEFLKSLCEDYRIILRDEYEWRTSEEQIIETIRANEYEFYEDGRMA